MATRTNEMYAYFSIAGEFDPAEVTSALRIEPTEIWLKGELNSRTQLERKASRWKLESRVDKMQDLERHVEDVLDQLWPSSDRILEVSKAYGGVMQLVGYFYSSYPGFGLKAGTIAVLAELGLSVDCDFY